MLVVYVLVYSWWKSGVRVLKSGYDRGYRFWVICIGMVVEIWIFGEVIR